MKHPRSFIQILALAAVTLTATGSVAWAAPESNPRFHPRRILVKPRADTSPDALSGLHAGARGRVARVFRGQGNLQVIELPTGDSVGAAVARYRASPLVQFAEPDYVVSATAAPDDLRYQDGTQWWLNNTGQNGGVADADIDAPEAWDVLASAPDVIVAVIDTGIRASHEDLAGNLWINPSDGSHGFNALTGANDPIDDNGHGTHLSGIIGAVGNNGVGISGIVWNMQIMACKFLDSNGDGFNSDAVACIEFAMTNGARVINTSWGGPEYSEAVSNALWVAGSHGIIVVAAAGNGGRDTDTEPFFPASLPLGNIVAVAASTRADVRWSNSSFGATTVDLFAPGAAMYSTQRGATNAYGPSDGTSWSAGVVSGAFALLRQQYPLMPYGELVQRVFATVDKRPAFSGYCVTGGRLNIRRALDRPSIQMLPGDALIELRVTGIPGHFYSIETTPNLGTWIPAHTGMSDSEGEWRVTDFDSTNALIRFYRAVPAP